MSDSIFRPAAKADVFGPPYVPTKPGRTIQFFNYSKEIALSDREFQKVIQEAWEALDGDIIELAMHLGINRGTFALWLNGLNLPTQSLREPIHQEVTKFVNR